jgi:arylsulfatase A-like enzyme
VAVLLACDEPPPAQPDLILVVLDTVRPDHLSTYGYERETSPHLDRFRRRATLFEHAYSTSTWTAPAHASAFTGLYPVGHGATIEGWDLDGEVSTLAEILSGAGYESIAVVGNPMIGKKQGYDQGFDIYVETWRRARAAKRQADAVTTEWVESLLASRTSTQPLFLFVNLVGAHNEYDSCGSSCGTFGADPEDGVVHNSWRQVYAGRRAFSQVELTRLGDLYDSEILEVDRYLARLLGALERAGKDERSAVVVMSDHGENLGDHGHLDHVFSLYESTTRVPLLIRFPHRFEPGGAREDRVSLVDLFPTLLEIAGVSAAAHPSQGRSLLGPPRDDGDAILSEYYRPGLLLEGTIELSEDEAARFEPFQRRMRTLERDGWKLHWGSDGRHELYHLAQDPEERFDRIDDPVAASVRGELLREIEALVTRYDRGRVDSGEARTELDAETRKELEALGYLEASPTHEP